MNTQISICALSALALSGCTSANEVDDQDHADIGTSGYECTLRSTETSSATGSETSESEFPFRFEPTCGELSQFSIEEHGLCNADLVSDDMPASTLLLDTAFGTSIAVSVALNEQSALTVVAETNFSDGIIGEIEIEAEPGSTQFSSGFSIFDHPSPDLAKVSYHVDCHLE